MADSKTLAKGLRWTKEKAEKAAKNAAFIHVRSTGDGKQGTRKLSGAEKTWKKASNAKQPTDDVYVLDYRVVGTRPDIQAALSAANVASYDIQRALDRAITVSNFAALVRGEGDRTLVRDVAAEIGNAKSVSSRKGDSNKYDNSISLATWAAIAEGGPVLGNVISGGESKTSPRSGRGGVPKKSLAARLASLEAGKVLDVSALTDAGANAKAINAPKADRNSTKMSLDEKTYSRGGYSKLASNNAKTLKQALTILGAPAATIEAVDRLYDSTGKKERAKAAPKAPKKKAAPKAKSPKPPKSPKTRTATPPRASAAADSKMQAPPVVSNLYAVPPVAPPVVTTLSPRQRYGGFTGAPSGFNQSVASAPVPPIGTF